MTVSPSITRRDFLEGVALALDTPGLAAAAMGGQTDELLAPAHAVRDDPARWRDGIAERDDGIEDLVVVGAGISGLAGAWLFRRHAGRPLRLLVLDALDEVGGHARRNEFVSRSGRRLVGYGGSQSLDTPGLFSPAVHDLLQGVGIELARFRNEFFDAGWRERHGLVNQADFFAREAWGEDRLVVRQPGEKAADWLPHTPLPPAAKASLARLLGPPLNVMPGLSAPALRARLAAMSYRDFLLWPWRQHPAAAACFAHSTLGYFGVGIDATSALDAWAAGLPGFGALPLGDAVDARNSPSGRQLKAGSDDYVYHFPDGNHGVVRALLRALRPELLPGQGMETLSSATLDSAALDDPKADLRVRQVLLACWHRVVARLSDELPAAQRHALDDQVKVPLVYATVLLSNWRAWQRLGIASIGTPGGFWQDAALDFPVSMGDLRFAASPDEPVLLHLGKVFASADGRDPRTQAAAGRAALMAMSFDRFEREVVALLQGVFGEGAAQDIEAVTVNRWAHGYSYEYMRPWDRFWPAGALPAVAARRGWGRVAIAGSDSGAYAYAHSAIDQATRAVQELLPRALLPAWARLPGPDPKAIGLER